MEKVKPGDPLRIPAATFNSMVDAAAFIKERRHDSASRMMPEIRGASIVLIKAQGTGDVPQCGIVGMDEPGAVFSPTDNLDGFKNGPVLQGEDPYAGADNEGSFVITLEPIAAGKIGRAVISGLAVCQVNVTDTSHRYACVANGDKDKLHSAAYGPALILWAETGTGTKWAIVKLGNALQSNGQSQYKVLAADGSGGVLWDWVRAH